MAIIEKITNNTTTQYKPGICHTYEDFAQVSNLRLSDKLTEYDYEELLSSIGVIECSNFQRTHWSTHRLGLFVGLNTKQWRAGNPIASEQTGAKTRIKHTHTHTRK